MGCGASAVRVGFVILAFVLFQRLSRLHKVLSELSRHSQIRKSSQIGRGKTAKRLQSAWVEGDKSRVGILEAPRWCSSQHLRDKNGNKAHAMMPDMQFKRYPTCHFCPYASPAARNTQMVGKAPGRGQRRPIPDFERLAAAKPAHEQSEWKSCQQNQTCSAERRPRPELGLGGGRVRSWEQRKGPCNMQYAAASANMCGQVRNFWAPPPLYVMSASDMATGPRRRDESSRSPIDRLAPGF